jgi:apolipoprotein D and lipocalin family protein
MTNALAPLNALRPLASGRNARLLLVGLPLLALLAACATIPPDRRDDSIPLNAHPDVDVDRYLGVWHEIARFPVSFQAGCVETTATYTRREDGLIGVRNWCRKADGRESVANARARRAEDGATDGRLKVSFFGPFWANYWVLDRAEDYSWSLVGEPGGRFLWILSREPSISPALRDDLVSRLTARGYDVSALKWDSNAVR